MAHGTKLLLWLLLLGSPPLCLATESDVECLKLVLQSVTDPNGVLRSSWIFNNSTNILCRFIGVECWRPDENKVLSLNLSNLGLQGQFPRGLKNCSTMTALDLSSNNFEGPIPSDIAHQLPYLTTLNLSNNSFSGEIPEGIGNLTYLNVLNLQRNRLSGEIPQQLKALARLHSFNVAGNSLSGLIPSSLWRFGASNFSGNTELCGAPLDRRCRSHRRRWRLRRVRLHRINDESSIGAAAGFVLGFVVALYFPRCFVYSRRLHPYVVLMF